MNHFTFYKILASTPFYFSYAFIQVCSRNLVANCRLYLNHKYGTDILVVLFLGVVIPMQTFVFPFVSCSLKHGDVFIDNALLGEVDFDFVL